MKIKNKGKVHPSPYSSTTATTSSSDPIAATLQLLPAAVLALAAVLPPPDQEVLSYLLARSLHLSSSTYNRKSFYASSALSSAAHRSPSFHCGCFDCYTIYWRRWDSSPNRDLIHRVIDAFEDHLSSSSFSNSSYTVPLIGKSKVGGGGRRGKAMAVNREKSDRTVSSLQEESGINGGVLDVDDTAVLREKKIGEENDASLIEDSLAGSPPPISPPLPGLGGEGGNHKGLACKVLHDVLGILNSRLWNLWSPNV